MSRRDLTPGTATESQTEGHRASGTETPAGASQTATDLQVGANLGGRSPLSHGRRFAYADPPYPGQALRHYGKDGDPFDGDVAEVDHTELIERLERDFPDGWALSTSVPALPHVLALCPDAEASKKRTRNGRGGVKLGTGVRVCVWLRSAGSPFPPSRIMWTWEPVILRVPHWRQRHNHDFVRDTLVASQPHGFLGNSITGQKPKAFCYWIFDLLGARRDDELVDVFPGSGAVGHAWDAWSRQPQLEISGARHEQVELGEVA